MIATVTTNPAIDYNVQVDELVKNETATAKGALVFPGGGGVNVARTVTKLGEIDCTAYGFAGGPTGGWIKSLLDGESVKHDFIDTELDSRINLLLTLTPDRSLVRINTAGPEIGEDKGKELIKKLTTLDPAPKLLVLSGSLPGRKLPPPLPRDFFGRVIDEMRLKKPDVKVILDCRQQIALGPGVEKGPFVVKPSIEELGRLAGRQNLETEKDIISAAEALIERYKPTWFVISRGAEGCLVISKEKRYRVTSSERVGFTRVAAGDAFVGGLAWALAKDEPMDIAAKYAVAVGTATVLSPASALFRKEEVEQQLAKTTVESI
jgi:6-phosphofructokinase 2